MKKNIAGILLMTSFISLSTFAQKPYQGGAMGERVPLYCGSTGTSAADSTRLPILFQAKIMGLTPGVSYKYFARFISLSDTSSTTTTGAGIPIIMKKNGNWRNINNPDLGTAGAHDTFFTPLGQGDYTGWFGAVYTSDSRFAPGKYIYPVIIYEEIGSGASNVQKVFLPDSIEVLRFSTTQSAGNGTAIYGSSFVKGKSIVLLYDNSTGATPRPVSISYSENDALSFSNMQNWYNGKVNGIAGSWGTIIPNDLSAGIKRIESRDPGFDTIMYAHIEDDGAWGSDSTINRKGGAVKPVYIKSDYAPLVKAEFEFISNLTTLTESNTVVKMLVRRRYGNADSSKVSAFVVAGTATNGVDYNILTSFPLVFRPYGEVTDTIHVKINDDFSSEPTENVAIRLNNPVNAKIGFQTTHSVNINDNDIPVIRFAKKSQSVKESHGLLKVKLMMTSGSTTPTNVRVLVKQKTDSTFIPVDFKLGSGGSDTTVQFPGGSVTDSIEFNISIIDEKVSEDRSDTLILVLRSPTAPATIGADSLFMLIIEDNDAPPTYRFSKAGMTIGENGGSMRFRVDKIGGNSNQSDVAVRIDPDPKNAQAGTDFTFSTQVLVFTINDPDSAIITVPLINDNLSEPREDAVFVLGTLFNSKIGKPDTLRISIIDDDLPEYPISKVTAAKAPNFIPDSLNVHCALRGIVYGVNMGPVGNPLGLSFTMMDKTGGIQVYKPSGGTKGYTVTEGDSIQVYGRITQLNGMTQISQLDTIIKLGSNRPLKAPTVVNILNESTESALVKYNLVKLRNPSQWPSSAMAPNTSIVLKVLTANDSFDMVIDSETDIDGKPLPSVFFNVTGLGAQNDPSSPYTSNYRLFPRRITDITNLIVPTFSFTTTTSSAAEKIADSTSGFVMQCANLTSPQQVTLAIKGGTAIRNTDYQSNATKLFILNQTNPSVLIKIRLKDDALSESNETIIYVIRENNWGTIIGPDSIHTFTIIDDETTGLPANELSSSIRVYPNPAGTTIQVSSESSLIQEIKIYDVNGREVRNIDGIRNFETMLNLEGMNKGLYTLAIQTENGTVIKTIQIL